MDAGGGVEPPSSDSNSDILPLDEPAIKTTLLTEEKRDAKIKQTQQNKNFVALSSNVLE